VTAAVPAAAPAPTLGDRVILTDGLKYRIRRLPPGGFSARLQTSFNWHWTTIDVRDLEWDAGANAWRMPVTAYTAAP
jgi:hypothetical protein